MTQNKLPLKDVVKDSIARHRQKELRKLFNRQTNQALIANSRKSARKVRGKKVA